MLKKKLHDYKAMPLQTIMYEHSPLVLASLPSVHLQLCHQIHQTSEQQSSKKSKIIQYHQNVQCK